MRAVLLVLTSVVSLQLGAALSARLFPVIGVNATTGLRLTAAAAFLATTTRPQVRTWTRRQWGLVLLYGLDLVGMNGFFYQSIARIPLGTAITVEFVGPLALAVVLSRRPRDLLWALFAATGVVLLGLGEPGTRPDVVGLACALIAGAFWAGYIVIGARAARSGIGAGGLTMAVAVGAAVSLPIGLAEAGTQILTPSVLGLALGVGLLASAIPYRCEFAALGKLPKKVFSILLALEPAVGAAAGAALLNQPITLRSAVATLLVVAAATGSALSRETGD